MIIAIIKHKASSGVGPANGNPAGQVARIFDTYEEAKNLINQLEKYPMFDGARIFDGDEDIQDNRNGCTCNLDESKHCCPLFLDGECTN